ncbi:type II secretion system protein [Massilia sp. Se16.2.3]|uniref:type II secretion system protein n=1 Tax=Massilia sp. Se16.2.3 TaxID=2709303 RepID=UPI002803CBA3|nr:type II secretion system protein [Massilia sp. Se16.2.3]
MGAATLKVDSLLRRAAAEAELLEIGAAYGEALRSYAAATPRGFPTAPPTLQDLLKDPRFPGVRRHLRKIFVDPVTGRSEWGVVYRGSGGTGGVGVLAVYSLSQARPLKIGNFDARFQNFENKEHLSDWKFTAAGQSVSSAAPVAGWQPGQPGKPGQPGQPGTPPTVPPPPATPAPPEPAEPPATEPVEPPRERPPEPPPEPEPEPEPEPVTPRNRHRRPDAPSPDGDYLARRLKSRGRKPRAPSTPK